MILKDFPTEEFSNWQWCKQQWIIRKYPIWKCALCLTVLAALRRNDWTHQIPVLKTIILKLTFCIDLRKWKSIWFIPNTNCLSYFVLLHVKWWFGQTCVLSKKNIIFSTANHVEIQALCVCVLIFEVWSLLIDKY